MLKVNVAFNDFDEKGKRKNGETIPLKGGVYIPKVNMKGKSTVYVCEPVKDGRVNGIALLFKNDKERSDYLKKMK